MATTAHCIYCFEILDSHFQKRDPMRLAEVETTWAQYQKSLRSSSSSSKNASSESSSAEELAWKATDSHGQTEDEPPSTTEDDEDEDKDEDGEQEQKHSPTKRPKRRRKSLLSVPNLLQHRSQQQTQASKTHRSILASGSSSGSGSGSSSSLTPSSQSASTSSSKLTTPHSSTNISSASSSRSSLPTPPSDATARPITKPLSPSTSAPVTESPMFVTWNSISKSSYPGAKPHKTLRGCIGTFETQPIERGLRSYAKMAAFEDQRFSPLPASILSPPPSSTSNSNSLLSSRHQPSTLSCALTLLLDFQPCAHPLDWTLGTHGIRISFTDTSASSTGRGPRLGATYLPDVAVEQGWSKPETLVSLMRKAGWEGRSSEWEGAAKKGAMEVVRYRGVKSGAGWSEWWGWKEWLEAERKRDG